MRVVIKQMIKRLKSKNILKKGDKAPEVGPASRERRDWQVPDHHLKKLVE